MNAYFRDIETVNINFIGVHVPNSWEIQRTNEIIRPINIHMGREIAFYGEIITLDFKVIIQAILNSVIGNGRIEVVGKRIGVGRIGVANSKGVVKTNLKIFIADLQVTYATQGVSFVFGLIAIVIRRSNKGHIKRIVISP